MKNLIEVPKNILASDLNLSNTGPMLFKGFYEGKCTDDGTIQIHVGPYGGGWEIGKSHVIDHGKIKQDCGYAHMKYYTESGFSVNFCGHTGALISAFLDLEIYNLQTFTGQPVSIIVKSGPTYHKWDTQEGDPEYIGTVSQETAMNIIKEDKPDNSPENVAWARKALSEIQ